MLGWLRRLRLRVFAWRVRLHARAVGARVNVRVDPTSRLRGRTDLFVSGRTHTTLVIGPGAVIERGVLLHLRGGRIVIGPRTQVRDGCVLRIHGGVLEFVGDNVLSYHSTIHCDERVEVGHETIIGEHCTLADSNHERPAEPGMLIKETFHVAPIRIGRGTWIGAKCTITAGTTIGDDVMLGANAVVTSDLPSGVVAGGVPARVLRDAG